ncbi:uncharacterized protein LOC144105622 [Amblyomma americanum]
MVHSGERPHQCPDCGQRFTMGSSLAHHRRWHSVDSVPSHVCPRCGKEFSRGSSLNRHLLLHTGVKPHACSQCGKKFMRRSDAMKHERGSCSVAATRTATGEANETWPT